LQIIAKFENLHVKERKFCNNFFKYDRHCGRKHKCHSRYVLANCFGRTKENIGRLPPSLPWLQAYHARINAALEAA